MGTCVRVSKMQHKITVKSAEMNRTQERQQEQQFSLVINFKNAEKQCEQKVTEMLICLVAEFCEKMNR